MTQNEIRAAALAAAVEVVKMQVRPGIFGRPKTKWEGETVTPSKAVVLLAAKYEEYIETGSVS